ncbi:hypothetical protein EUTSA_v10027173mg [Eutrema salsugineum]|uniref:Aminotransferase-like plant mobile domain-containing protein n=1 Tax=Eutrema salsugineum TaxID=72664 RepID=V4P8A1_EUTSA|nr:hypothetical protein EUTSA_v10027173mg [Eutrema salsugineum]
MESTSIDANGVEEREELMVFPSESNNNLPIIRKTHFLEHHNGSEAIRRPAPCSDLKASPLCVTFCGWRLPNQKFKSWFRKMAALHKPTWIKAGIFEAIQASTYKINKNTSLILSLARKWSPETRTFVFPWGEATITLEDVTVLLGFSVLGSSVSAPLERSEMDEAVEKLERRRKESVKQFSWISSFVDDQMEHEAFLVFWLSNFVFPDKSGCSISKAVFPIAVRLARGERISLAPAVLANVYRDLGKIHALASNQKVRLHSLLKLVQVWTWERFKSIRPQAKLIPRGEPRIAQWSGLKQKLENVGLFLLDDFDCRPYTKPLMNWNPPRFYSEEAKRISIDGNSLDDDDDDELVSFARCVRVSKLVGIDFTEDYYPNRVGMQFGLAQDIPVSVTNHRSNFTEKEAREDHNRPLDGSKQCIPSRLTKASVTAARYRDWWMKSVSKIQKEPAETFNASNTVDHYDDSDDDVSLKVVPLSQVFEKLGDGKKKTEQLKNKRRKCASAGEDDNESAMDCFHMQDEEEDDNTTIAQRIKSIKKCGDVKGTGGERSRLGVDSNVSGLAQKLAYGAETVATTEIKQMSEESDKKNSADPSNGAAEKEEEDDDERWKLRKLAIEELALKLEARILKVEKTLAKIKQWKMRKNLIKTPVSA